MVGKGRGKQICLRGRIGRGFPRVHCRCGKGLGMVGVVCRFWVRWKEGGVIGTVGNRGGGFSSCRERG